MRVRVTLVAEPDGDRFHAYCAELTSVHAVGDTEQDAFRRIRQTVKTHLRAIKHYDIPLRPASWKHPEADSLPDDHAYLRFEPTESNIQRSCASIPFTAPLVYYSRAY